MNLRRTYDDRFRARARSETVRRLFREAIGDGYDADVEPLSWVTVGELDELSRALSAGRGSLLADLGCGAGGPGLFVARGTGSRLVGVDLSEVACSEAEGRAAERFADVEARFVRADMTATGLDAGSFDGVLSVDSLCVVPDRAGAIREAARLLRPGARLAFTSWELSGAPRAWGEQTPDHAPLVDAAGLVLERQEETPGWRERQLRFYRQVLESQDELRADVGADATRDMVAQAQELPAFLQRGRRVLVVARRPA